MKTLIKLELNKLISNKLLFLLFGLTIFSMDERITQTLSSQQFILYIFTEHYYLTYLMMPIFMLSTYSSLGDDMEYILIRSTSYWNYFKGKLAVCGIFSFMFVIAQFVVAFIMSIGLRSDNSFNVPNNPSYELFGYYSQHFSSVTQAIFINCIYMIAGLFIVSIAFFTINNFFSKKVSTKIIIIAYILMIFGLKIDKVNNLPIVFIDNYIIFHRNFGYDLKLFINILTMTTVLIVVCILNKKYWNKKLKIKDIRKNKIEADNDLVDDHDYPKFADRPYQIDAINAMEDAIKNGKKRILLAMATGTGKTRTAISLMYRLLKHKRARRILYLVDRNSLGRQTANAIKDNKIGTMSISSIYGLKELSDKVPDASTKIQIATVQGMIKRLFFSDDNSEKPSVGQYDFIIVDEAHRGYAEDKELSDNEYQFYNQEEYVSQYRRVVDYFDATAIGMTSTPALQTTEIFGDPVYTYSYQQAVLDGYLVDHDAPVIIKTKLAKEGIHFKKGTEVDIFDQDEKTINKEKLPDNMNFDVKDFNHRVITRNFNKVVCDELVKKYLDTTDPYLGKTLIFAATDAHADMVVDLLKQAFKEQGRPVDDDAIEKITGSIRHPNQEIKNFKNEENPNIVVTVDLLTTGIDVPRITNIVFLRRVQSRILYEQMLGRATRLCPEIHKEKFTIFDAVGIYDAMNKVTNMKPVVKNPGHNVHYFLSHKNYFETNEDTNQYQVDMAGAVERKIKRWDDQRRREFERLAEIKSVDSWARKLSKLTKTDFLKEWPKFVQLDHINTARPKQFISDAPDEVVDVSRGYGSGNQKPEDYIDSFNNFIKQNVNTIPALQVVATRPKDLTFDELKEIKLKLEQNGFKEKDLQTAWKNAKHVQTTADIISFIRQVAAGSELVDHDVRIHNAMQKVYGMADWSISQRKWLKRIENQLMSSTVLGPNAEEAFNDNFYFKRQGGYKQIKKIFPEYADQIIYVLNENLYV